ncbi:hypothetical protein STEG23_030485, partial [Scotinomys teguina]
MGRRQCKSAYNIIKNKTTPESSPPPTPKSDYCNADKAEENDLKKSLMKMLEEVFEEKMKNVSKEIGENTNKKLEEINKEIEEKKSKTLEEMNNEIEEKKNKKLEEMNNEIEEKKNKRVEEMNKEIEEKRNKKLQELDKEIEEKINKKLKEMNKEIEEKMNKKLEEINKVIEEKTNKKLDEINKEIEDKTNKKLEKINKEIDGKKTKELEEMKKEIEEKVNRKWGEIKKFEEKKNKRLEEMNKENEEKTNKKMEDLKKVLKESQDNQQKTIKHMKETTQDIKIEIEKLKKTLSEGMLEIEKLSKRSGNTDASITNRIQEMEDRISNVEDTIEEIDSTVKENTKTKKAIKQNVQEIWDTMKRPNIRIIGIEEGEEYQLKGMENIFNKIIEENFPNLKKEPPIKIQEAYRTPNRLDPQKKSSRHIIIKTLNIQNKERILRAAKEKGQLTYKGRPIRITPDFSVETLQARRNVPCIPTFSKAFIMKGCWILSKAFSASNEMIMWFFSFNLFISCYISNFISDFINLDALSAFCMWSILEKVPWGAEKKQKDGSCFHIHSVNLCLFIGWNLHSSAFCKAGFVDRLGLFMVSQISWTICFMTFFHLVFSLTDESISSI